MREPPIGEYGIFAECGGCGRKLYGPFKKVTFNRKDEMTVTVWCNTCKSDVEAVYKTSLLALMAEDRDGYVPTKH